MFKRGLEAHSTVKSCYWAHIVVSNRPLPFGIMTFGTLRLQSTSIYVCWEISEILVTLAGKNKII